MRNANTMVVEALRHRAVPFDYDKLANILDYRIGDERESWFKFAKICEICG